MLRSPKVDASYNTNRIRKYYSTMSFSLTYPAFVWPIPFALYNAKRTFARLASIANSKPKVVRYAIEGSQVRGLVRMAIAVLVVSFSLTATSSSEVISIAFYVARKMTKFTSNKMVTLTWWGIIRHTSHRHFSILSLLRVLFVFFGMFG
jgi:hypothetical protein